MEATSSTEATAAVSAPAPQENEPSQVASVVEQQAQQPESTAQQSEVASEAHREEKQAQLAIQTRTNPAAQAAQPKQTPAITRDRYNQQSLGVSLNSTVKKVRSRLVPAVSHEFEPAID